MTISAQRAGDFLSIQKGKVTYIHSGPRFAKITLAGTQNQVYVSEKLVKTHNLRVGNNVEFKSKTYEKGPSVTEFTKVRGADVISKPQRTQKSNNENRSNSKRNQQKESPCSSRVNLAERKSKLNEAKNNRFYNFEPGNR